MNLQIKKLNEEQIKLAKKIIAKDEFDTIKTIAGCDQAFSGDKIISAIVVCDYETMDIIEKKYAVKETSFPHIAGYVSYREAPAVIEAYEKLKAEPDILLIEGNDILHPRRIGLASHVGLLLDKATIGVANKLLIGEVKDGKVFVNNEARAFLIKTKEHAKPIYVSPGHKVSLRSSLAIAKKCILGDYKLPEPIRLAHKYANKLKKDLMKEKSEE